MAFGSGSNNNSKHHHHHNQNQQHFHSSAPLRNHHHVPGNNQQSASSVPPAVAVPSGSDPIGGGPGPPVVTAPDLPPKSYYNDNSKRGHHSHHHPHHQHRSTHDPSTSQQPHHSTHHHHPHPRSSQFQSGGRASKQSFGDGAGGFVGGDRIGMMMDERLVNYFPTGGGGGAAGGNQQVNSASSLSQQQKYNQHLVGHHHQGQPHLHQLNRDLTEPERVMLDQIRAKKAVLLKEIAQLQDEIDSVSKELLYSQKDSVDSRAHYPAGAVPDLIQQQQHNPPLADIEMDNLSENSNQDEGGGGDGLPTKTTKVASSSVLGSNNSSVSNASSNASKEKDRLKLMSLGCKKFNMDQKKGIEFLVENGLLKKDDEMDVGMFLYRGEGLNKTAIGDYLGERSDFNERVLRVFVGLHDFTDLILVQALRQFLWSFRLPGEAQKIDRMMECFAQRYCQNNPDIFTNTDTCYVLSFAIIMLNTSLHNPSVKDKPTVEQFISMNRGINNGGDLPRELLVSLYNSIQSEPFKIPEDDGNDLMTTFFNPDKEGWLWKQGGRYKTWKRRWFILNDNCLYYFEFTTDKEPRGIIPLENVGVREILEGGGASGGGILGRDKERSGGKQRYCFELYATDGSEVIKACKTDSDGRVVEGKHSVYRMSAGSGEERDSWVKALRQSISYSPFYEILRKSGGPGGGGGGASGGSGGLRGGGTSRLRIE